MVILEKSENINSLRSTLFESGKKHTGGGLFNLSPPPSAGIGLNLGRGVYCIWWVGGKVTEPSQDLAPQIRGGVWLVMKGGGVRRIQKSGFNIENLLLRVVGLGLVAATLPRVNEPARARSCHSSDQIKF